MPEFVFTMQGVTRVHPPDKKVLDNVTLAFLPGAKIGVLGANGSGKSSLMNAVSGLVTPAAGRVTFDGADITTVPTYRRLARGLAHVLERRRLFSYMTVRENLLLGAYVPAMRPARAETLESVLVMFPALRDRQSQLAHTLSGGEQQMVAIGRALMSRPQALLLDEPSLGLAPLVVKQVFEVIQRINRAGTTVLLAEQNAYAALKIAHRAYVIEGGRIVAQGTAAGIAADGMLARAYLGAAS